MSNSPPRSQPDGPPELSEARANVDMAMTSAAPSRQQRVEEAGRGAPAGDNEGPRRALGASPRHTDGSTVQGGTSARGAGSSGVAGGREPSISQTRRTERRSSANPYSQESRRAGEDETSAAAAQSVPPAVPPAEPDQGSSGHRPPPAERPVPLAPGDAAEPVGLQRTESSTSSTGTT